MKYFVIAGESSGDVHGALLINALRLKDNSTEILAWGGNKMENAGAKILKHYKELAFMGFVEVVLNLGSILKNFTLVKQQINAFKPDVIIFIDYPGFNLRLAKWAKEQQYKTVYYISPQLWAWKAGRIEIIKKYIDEMLCILPFEKDWYSARGVHVHYIGHPLVQVIEQASQDDSINLKINQNKKIIALLPGSRKQELSKKLPLMLSMASHFPDFQFVICKAPHCDFSTFEVLISNLSNVSIEEQNTYGVLKNAYAALVTSGTATLETALFKVPQVVCYKANAISYQIGKRLVKVPFISLVNLIAGKAIVTELIQHDYNENRLQQELSFILDETNREQIIREYHKLHEILASENAPNKAADIIINMLH